jgi:hypothetical protein
MTWHTGGYNNWFSVDASGSKFQLKFNKKASTLYENFDQAADNAAQLLYQEWGHKPLYLALSGGLDSELTARILVKNNIPFTPVILKIKDYNDFETWYAEYWCRQNNVNPIILNYSVDKLLDLMVRFYPKLNQIKNFSQTSILTIYEYVHNLNGACIYSAGDINFDISKKEFFCASLDFISDIVDPGTHPTSFFMYTPEIALSYVNQFDTDEIEQFNKLKFYQVSPRPKIDYTALIKQNKKWQQIQEQFFYIFKLEKFDQYHWYGTKEQIIQALSP